jgi:undecaprenyl-diphosphatase
MSPLDTRIFLQLYGAGGPLLLWTALALSTLGGGWATFALVPLFANRRSRRLAAWLAAVIVFNAVAVSLIKAAVGRTRPYLALAGVRPLADAPVDPSFPSGHACGAFAVALFLVVVLRSTGVPGWRPASVRLLQTGMLVVAAGVAWSRVRLGVHYPSDVAAGALLGSAVGSYAAWLFSRRGSP